MNYLELKKSVRDALRGFKEGLRDLRVLVVEYDTSSANMLVNVLKRLGFEKVNKTNRTAHALELIEGGGFDIYFINYRLRGEEMGINVVDYLYGYGFLDRSIALLLLGEKEKVPPDFPPEYNSDGILRKPYKPHRVCAMISDACTKKLVRLETTRLVAQNKTREAVVLNLQNSGRVKSKVWGTLSAGNIYEKKNNFEDAVTLYRSTLKLFPDCAITYDAIGLVFRKVERNHEAEYNFIKAADKNPYYLRAKHHLAELYYWNGEKEKARQILKLALRINPLSPRTNKDFARVSADLGDHEAAKKALKIVLQDPREAENPSTLIDYGNELMINKNLDEAIENFNKSIGKATTQENIEDQARILKTALMGKGNCYLKYDDPEKIKLADGCFKAVERSLIREEAPQEVRDEHQLTVGRSYLEHGMEQKAGRTLSEYMDKDPKNKERQGKVTGIYKFFNKIRKGVEIIEGALKRAMDNIEQEDKKNRKLRKEGRFKEAVEGYQRLVERYPSDDGLYFNRGRTFLEWSRKLGEDTEEGMEKLTLAKRNFYSALQLDQERIEPALEKIGLSEQAAAWFNLAIDT